MLLKTKVREVSFTFNWTYHGVALLDIEEVPKIDQHCCPECEEDNYSVDFASEIAGKADTSCDEPSPPFG